MNPGTVPVFPNASPAGPPAGPGPETQVTYCFLSELLKAKVRYEGERKPFGRLLDLGARPTPTPYPVVASLQVESSRQGVRVIPWSAVTGFSVREFVVRREPGEAPEVSFWLRRDILDDQVVDVSGAKARRVNDVHFLQAEGQLIIAHVAVGSRSILRRLGVERPVSFLLKWLLDYELRDSFVSWKNVEILAIGGAAGEVRFSGASSQLAEIHPAEMADIIERLGTTERQTLFNKLPLDAAAEALPELDADMQRMLISQQKPDKAADILEKMPVKDTAALLRDLQEGEAEKIISRMETEAAEDVQTLLSHEEASAGGVMETVCIEVRSDQRADQVLADLRAMTEKAGVFSYVFVLDGQRHLLGVATLRELLGAAPDALVESLMTRHIVKVSPETGLREVVWLFAKYGFRAIPVVDEQNVFLGAVRFRSLLAQLSPLFRK